MGCIDEKPPASVDYPQRKNPGRQEDAEGASVVARNVEICFSAFPFPHEGHFIFDSSFQVGIHSSKVSPQSGHLYSKMGIAEFPANNS
jgi:hypothetical protein